MRKIKKAVEDIADELKSAKEYAECYVEHKSRGDSVWANRFKEMANDELRHATYLHDKAIAFIDSIKNVYTPTQEMEEKWEKSHKCYVEDEAEVRRILAM